MNHLQKELEQPKPAAENMPILTKRWAILAKASLKPITISLNVSILRKMRKNTHPLRKIYIAYFRYISPP